MFWIWVTLLYSQIITTLPKNGYSLRIISGAVIMGIGSLVFVVPHFIAEVNSETLANNKSDDNICRLPRALEADMGGLGRLSQGLPPSNLRPDNCIKVSEFTVYSLDSCILVGLVYWFKFLMILYSFFF